MSIGQTAKKYRGRKAETYDAVRTKQRRWTLENEAVARLLPKGTNSVLDCPVGTGRFLQMYKKLGVETVVGLDVSEEMLALARRKCPRGVHDYSLTVGDATNISVTDKQIDAAVCVRFLDLIDEAAMRRVVAELCRVARVAVVLTIRLGDTYVPKSNTAEHDRKGFNRLVKRLGWKIEESVPIFEAGWTVMRLGRR